MESLISENQDPFFNSVDNVLVGVFGQKGACLIYKYIEEHYCVKRNELCNNPDVLVRGLNDCLGAGALPFELKILFDRYGITGLSKKP